MHLISIVQSILKWLQISDLQGFKCKGLYLPFGNESQNVNISGVAMHSLDFLQMLWISACLPTQHTLKREQAILVYKFAPQILLDWHIR